MKLLQICINIIINPLPTEEVFYLFPRGIKQLFLYATFYEFDVRFGFFEARAFR